MRFELTIREILHILYAAGFDVTTLSQNGSAEAIVTERRTGLTHASVDQEAAVALRKAAECFGFDIDADDPGSTRALMIALPTRSSRKSATGPRRSARPTHEGRRAESP